MRLGIGITPRDVVIIGGSGGGVPQQYIPPQTSLELDINPDFIPDDDGATITSLANQATGGGNAFVSVTGTPTVHDIVYNGHRAMRFDGTEHLTYTADTNHTTACTVYAVFKRTSNGANMSAIELYSAGVERNSFGICRTASDWQTFWNNETSWKTASSGTPTIANGTLYTRGWIVWGTTTIDWEYISDDGGVEVTEEELISSSNGMEDFTTYVVGGGTASGDMIGDLARLFVYSVDHTPAEAHAIVVALRTEYGST